MTNKGLYTIKKLTFWLINKECRADCRRPFKVGDEVVRLAGNYRGRQDKMYHRDC